MSKNKQTPKEKARELYLAYWYLTNASRIAEQFALIAVDEILMAIQDFPLDEVNWDYWTKVKQEIEKYEQQ